MWFNFSYIAHFIGGIVCIWLSSKIFSAHNSGGFIFQASGMEAHIRAVLLVVVGVYLLSFPFRIKKVGVTWLDIFFMLGLIISTEPIAHVISLVVRQ